MKIFAPNSVVAKSRFFNYLRRLKKVKASRSDILHLQEVEEVETSTVKNFGIWVRYNSKTGIHNMYKEFRDVSLAGAVNQLYSDMSSKHKASYANISITKTAVLGKDEVRRPYISQFASDKFTKFPVLRQGRKVEKRYKKTFSAVKPSNFGF